MCRDGGRITKDARQGVVRLSRVMPDNLVGEEGDDEPAGSLVSRSHQEQSRRQRGNVTEYTWEGIRRTRQAGSEGTNPQSGAFHVALGVVNTVAAPEHARDDIEMESRCGSPRVGPSLQYRHGPRRGEGDHEVADEFGVDVLHGDCGPEGC